MQKRKTRGASVFNATTRSILVCVVLWWQHVRRVWSVCIGAKGEQGLLIINGTCHAHFVSVCGSLVPLGLIVGFYTRYLFNPRVCKPELYLLLIKQAVCKCQMRPGHPPSRWVSDAIVTASDLQLRGCGFCCRLWHYYVTTLGKL